MNNKLISLAVVTIALTTSLNAKVFATVNGEEITEKDIALIVKDPRVNVSTLPQNVQQQILNQTIDAKLLEIEAVKSDVLNSSEFKANLEKLKSKLALDFYIKNQLDDIKVNDSDVKKEYDNISSKIEVKASHILLKTEKEAADIISKLNNSKDVAADFVTFAKESSIGPSATVGGDLGFFTKEKMVAEFSKAAFSMKKGEFTKEAVKTQFGFHVILKTDERKAKIAPYETIKEKLKMGMKYQKLQAFLGEKVKSLRKKAKISIK